MHNISGIMFVSLDLCKTQVNTYDIKAASVYIPAEVAAAVVFAADAAVAVADAVEFKVADDAVVVVADAVAVAADAVVVAAVVAPVISTSASPDTTLQTTLAVTSV